MSLLLALLLSSAHASEPDCREIRLDAPGGSMEHIAVRDQGQLGICFAETVVQAYDAYRNSNGQNRSRRNTSAYVLAARQQDVQNNYYEAISQAMSQSAGYTGKGMFAPGVSMPDASEFNRIKDAGSLNGGEPCKTFDVLKEFGSAPALKDELTNLDPLTTFLFDQWRRLHGTPKPSSALIPEIELSQSAAEIQTCLTSQGLDVQLEKIADALKSTDRKVIKSVVAHARNRLEQVPSEITCETILSKASERQQTELLYSNHFKSKKPVQPLIVSFCSAILTDSASGTYFKLKDGVRVADNNCGSHAVLAIGQRRDPKDKNKCQILIRNSWGKNSTSYLPEIEKAGDGNVWVDRSSLSANTFWLQRLKNEFRRNHTE